MIWLLNWISAETVMLINWALIGLGLIILLVASFIRYFPVINIYRIPIQLAAVVLLTFGIYFKGALEVELEWKQRVADLEKKVAAAEAKSQEINTQIVTEVVTKVEKQIVYRDKIKKEIQVQKEYIDRDCKLNPAAIEMYNKAVAGEQK